MDLDARRDAMLRAFHAKGRVLVAYSGGVDSGLVAKLAHEALDGNALAVITDAESLSRRELAEAKASAGEIGIALRGVGVSELASPEDVAEPVNPGCLWRAEMAARP